MNRTKPRLVVSSRSLAHLNQSNLANPPKRIGSISAPYQLNPLTTRRQIAQILVQTLSYPAEFEHQPPSNSDLAHSQAHLSMPLAQHGLVEHLVLVGRGYQGRQPLDQLQAGQGDGDAAIRPGALQQQPHRAVGPLLQAALGQRGASDIAAEALQALPIAGSDDHTGVHTVAIAAGAAGGKPEGSPTQ